MSTYVGNGKRHPKFEGVISFGFRAEDLETLKDNISNGWVNVLIQPKKDDPDRFTCKIDDYRTR